MYRPLDAGRGPKNHATRGPCSEINQRKSNRKSNKSMEIKVIFSKISYGKPYSEPKNPKKFPLASLATHEEEFSAQNARFFCPKTPRTRFVLQKPCKMRQNEPRIIIIKTGSTVGRELYRLLLCPFFGGIRLLFGASQRTFPTAPSGIVCPSNLAGSEHPTRRKVT